MPPIPIVLSHLNCSNNPLDDFASLIDANITSLDISQIDITEKLVKQLQLCELTQLKINTLDNHSILDLNNDNDTDAIEKHLNERIYFIEAMELESKLANTQPNSKRKMKI